VTSSVITRIVLFCSCCACCYSEENVHADNCCTCNTSAVLRSTGIEKGDIVYANFTNKVTIMLFVNSG